ncbi:MAG: Spy/CpxP family protein refolding chaperone [Chthoniobacterales bacterium]
MLTPDKVVEGMKNELSLTDSQVKQVTPLVEELMKTMNALREDQSLTREQKMEQAKTAGIAYNSKFLAVLTPEQRTKLEGLHKVMMEKMKEHEATVRATQGASSAVPSPSTTP